VVYGGKGVKVLFIFGRVFKRWKKSSWGREQHKEETEERRKTTLP